MSSWKLLVGVLSLVVWYALLFASGAALLGPRLPGPPSQDSAGAGFALALAVIAILDVALLTVIVRRSRLHGVRLAVMLAAFLYGVKTFSSAIEAAYFMRNLSADMVPRLFAMTLPLVLLFPPAMVLALGRARGTGAEPGPALRPFGFGPAAFAARVGLLSCVVYPALFLLAGWFIAYASPEVRAFYGGAPGGSFGAHLIAIAHREPELFLLESARGALWVLLALPVLATTRGPWWHGTLLVAASFAVIQNDVHLLPNPLMPPAVRLYHLIETASSNFVWAFAIGYVLCRPSERAVVATRTTGSAPA